MLRRSLSYASGSIEEENRRPIIRRHTLSDASVKEERQEERREIENSLCDAASSFKEERQERRWLLGK